MPASTSKFQLILTGVFAVFIVVGVLFFSFFKGDEQTLGTVSVWGTITHEAFADIYGKSPLYKDKTVRVTYTQKNEKDFSEEFVDSLASGVGPDLVLVPHEFVLEHRNKFYATPYESYPERAYRDTFIEEAELFLFNDGLIAVPVAVDPLVMYWNRNLFTNEGVANPPKSWAEFYGLAAQFVEKDGAFNIVKTFAALGEYRNISNAKALISTLIMQAGNPIAIRTALGNQSVLSENFEKPTPPAQSALTFFTEFSNPAKVHYSWNRSMPNSQDFFLAGDLGVYFGFASELAYLRAKNPNLNFDVTTVPQSQSGERNTTYGRLYAFAMPRNSKNLPGAFKVAFTFANTPESARGFSEVLAIAPARRDLLAQRPSDPFKAVFYESALWGRGWLDPNGADTAVIFQGMIESITGGRARIQDAITIADSEIDLLFK